MGCEEVRVERCEGVRMKRCEGERMGMWVVGCLVEERIMGNKIIISQL